MKVCYASVATYVTETQGAFPCIFHQTTTPRLKSIKKSCSMKYYKSKFIDIHQLITGEYIYKIIINYYKERYTQLYYLTIEKNNYSERRNIMDVSGLCPLTVNIYYVPR